MCVYACVYLTFILPLTYLSICLLLSIEDSGSSLDVNPFLLLTILYLMCRLNKRMK